MTSYQYNKAYDKIYKNKLNETEKLSLSADINIKELSNPNDTKITYNKNIFKKTDLTPKEDLDKNEIYFFYFMNIHYEIIIYKIINLNFKI